MSLRVLVTGGGFVNKGAEAMVRCVQDGVLSTIHQVESLLRVSTNDKRAARELRDLILQKQYSRQARVMATPASWMLPLVPAARRTQWLETVSGADCAIDLVLDISGYRYHDSQVDSTFQRIKSKIRSMMVTHRELLIKLGVPFIYLPQAWGPLRRPESRAQAIRIMETALRIYARDQESLEWLQTLPSFSPEKVSLASDIAFTFKGASSEIGQNLLRDIGIKPGGAPLIGIVPNMRVYERVSGEGEENLYVRRLVDLARHFTENLDCQIALMPHEIKPQGAQTPDDRFLCRLIADEVDRPEKVCAALGDYSAEELKAMIGEVDLLVASRYHSIIAALSLRIPVVSIAWSHKYRELMSSVGLGDYVVPHETLDSKSLCNLGEQAWERREHLQELLEEHVPKHEASAQAVLQEVVELIHEIQGSQ